MNIETLLSLTAKLIVLGGCAAFLGFFLKNPKKTWGGYLLALWAVAIVISQAIVLIKNFLGK